MSLKSRERVATEVSSLLNAGHAVLNPADLCIKRDINSHCAKLSGTNSPLHHNLPEVYVTCA